MLEASTASFPVSLSAFQSWQRCEARYFYQYIRKLRRRDQFVAPTLGRILHSYLESFYDGLREDLTAEDAHLRSQLKTSQTYLPEIRGYVNTALLGGAEDLARELNALPEQAGRITDRYFVVHGRSDAERYKVILVEQYLNLEISDGIRSTGIVDLVTQDLETGRLNLWEHKSTQNIPQDSVRLRDFQTMLYAVKLRWQSGMIIDSVVWNYMRTREPTVPEQLKSGSITKRKDIDTTWAVYAGAIEDAGGDPNSLEYLEVKERLLPRENVIYFPRYEKVIVVEEGVLMDDYIAEAQRMRRARSDWAHGVAKPIRSISRDCDYCEFFRICEAALTGGDEDDVIRLRFKEGNGE